MTIKNLLTILFISLSTGLFGQSWVNVVVQTDNYGGETSWEIYQDSELMATSPLYSSNSYNETIVNLPAGGYNFIIYDEYGDGICCDWGQGHFGLKNICDLNTFVYDFNGPMMTIYFDLLACPPPVFGCMDIEAINFNPWANAPSSCTFPPAPCDTGATNVIVLVSPDSYPSETSWDITANGEVISFGDGYSTPGVTVPTYVCVSEGDTLVANIYDSYGDGLCGTCWGGIDGYFDVTTLCGDSIFFIGGAQEFDTVSSGAYIVPPCIPFVSQGCTDSGYVEYNASAVIDDGSCVTEVLLGCTDPSMFNFDPAANTMDVEPSCEYTLITTDGGADGWFGSWIGVTQGEDIYGPYQMGPNDGYEEEFILNLFSDEEVKVYFFTSGNAETTAAQCGFRLEGPNDIVIQSGTNPWTDPLKKFPYVYSGVPICLNYCEPFTYGCTDESAQNYDTNANTDDSGCYYDAGCMQAGYLEYYTQGYFADYDDGSCNTLAVFGCTDELALNYDTEANVDINSCIEVIIDCTDPIAANYNEEANTPDNESCLYDAGCIGEPGDPYYLNDSCYAWIIDIDAYCCEVAWDGACIELYDYCESGWPTGVYDIHSTYNVYPNPVIDVLNIQTSLDVFTEVYDLTGHLIVSRTKKKRIDLRELPSGVYQVVINYNGRIINKKIVKI